MSQQAAAKFQVATCNVLYEPYYQRHCKTDKMPYKERLDAWQNFVSGHRSIVPSYDIICLQEISSQDADWEGPLNAVGFSIEYSNVKQGHDSTAVAWSRNFVKLASAHHTFGGSKSACKVLLQHKTSGDVVVAVSAHLHSFPGDQQAQHDILTQLHDFCVQPVVGPRRLEIEKDTTILVAGDFNMRPFRTLIDLEKAMRGVSTVKESELQATLQANGETIPVFSGRRGWTDLTLPFDWTYSGSGGPSRLDFVLQSNHNCTASNNNGEGGSTNFQARNAEQRFPQKSEDLVSHVLLADSSAPAYCKDYFSDHAFLGVTLTCSATPLKELLVPRRGSARIEFITDPVALKIEDQLIPVSSLLHNRGVKHLLARPQHEGTYCRSSRDHDPRECTYIHRKNPLPVLTVRTANSQQATAGGDHEKAGSSQVPKGRTPTEEIQTQKKLPAEAHHQIAPRGSAPDSPRSSSSHREDAINVDGALVPVSTLIPNRAVEHLRSHPKHQGKYCRERREHDPMVCSYVHRKLQPPDHRQGHPQHGGAR